MLHSGYSQVVPTLLIVSFAVTFVVALPQPLDALTLLEPAVDVHPLSSFSLIKRDSNHHSHGAPLTELNETEVTMYHAPTPPSYWSIDFEDRDPTAARYPGLLVLHSILMGMAFFLALPIGIAMRSVKHSWHGFTVLVFYILCALGCIAGALYSKLTPKMYKGEIHSSHGYLIILFSLFLSLFDVMGLVCRFISFIKSGERVALKIFWRSVVLGHELPLKDLHPEYTSLVVEEPEEYEQMELKPSGTFSASDAQQPPSAHTAPDLQGYLTSQRADDVHHQNHHRHSQSCSSDGTAIDLQSPISKLSDNTLHDQSYDSPASHFKVPLLMRLGRIGFDAAERTLVVAGFGQLLTGIVVYTGGCRENYMNGCLAHLIKGGIFWTYGLITFARFLGSFSEYGWSWNRAPSDQTPSAEMVESCVVFLYGITNTWMERFGAQHGDPYTTKQIQHIGIAVMFWFAGLIGMGIESKGVRRWLASASMLRSSRKEHLSEPPSYSASFNPFPALVIGVTGATMAAHAQTYLFQVQIHSLWGNMLLGFSVLRCLTYFFLWLAPPRSMLPSRPPTEALASFFLACGGLTFMLSTEEVTLAAMRKGRDDVMMFLNVAVAVTCFAFCWTLSVVTFNGWLKNRSHHVAF